MALSQKMFSAVFVLALSMPLMTTTTTAAASTSSNEVPSSTLEASRGGAAVPDPASPNDKGYNPYNVTSLLAEPKRHRRRNRRCKCLKRYTKEVSQMIDDRLEDFENRYLLHLNRDKERSLAMRNEASSTSSRIHSIDRLLLKLNTDVVQTKEALSLMNANLDVIRHEMNHTRGDVRSLNVSFHELDVAVENLTRFVSTVERMIPAGLAMPTSGSQLEDAAPKQSYPRREFLCVVLEL